MNPCVLATQSHRQQPRQQIDLQYPQLRNYITRNWAALKGCDVYIDMNDAHFADKGLKPHIKVCSCCSVANVRAQLQLRVPCTGPVVVNCN